MNDNEERVVLVDEKDNKIGLKDKLQAHQNGGTLHRAFSIFVFNSKGETLLQKRAKTKYHTPGKWTNACCSHPRENENVMDAAHRRLKEEMGFDCGMHEEFTFVYKAEVGNGLTENEYDHVIFGGFNDEPKPSKDEVDDWKWISLKALKEDIGKNPDAYTPWIRMVIDRVIEARSKSLRAAATLESDGFEQFLKEKGAIINMRLEEALQKESSDRYIKSLLGRSGYKYDTEAINKSILDPAWHLLALGGKRWRPIMMALCLEALGKDPDKYAEFTLIPEVVHNATLVHDDIEDNSLTRRGGPSVHVKYGIDIGVNLADFLFYFPMVALVDSKKLSTETKNKAMNVYIREMLRVTTGQATDIAWHNHLVDPYKIDEDKYLQMVYDKTGVLARMAAKLAAVIAEADDKTLEAMGYFGATVGVAFQIQDDVLNLYESGVSATKGGVGDDISEGKITLLVIYTLKHASETDKKRLITILEMHTKDKKLIQEAIDIITKYKAREYAQKEEERLIKEAWSGIDKVLPDSDAKRKLKELADFLISRTI